MAAVMDERSRRGRALTPGELEARVREARQVGAWLADLRERAGMTQQQTVDALRRYGANVQAQQVSAWENGRALPAASQMLRLLVVYGVLPAEATHDDAQRREDFVGLLRRATTRGEPGTPGGQGA